MVKIRLRRVGAKKQPSYRVVVADSRSPRDGRFIEVIGFYNPRTEPETVKIEEDRALHWLGVGAQPTEAVARLLKNKGTLARFERLKQGESLEALLAEAEEAAQAAPAVDPKTRHKAKPAAETPEPEVSVLEEVEAEVAEPEEPEAEEPEAETPETEDEAEEEEASEPDVAEDEGGEETAEETEDETEEEPEE